MIINLTDVTVKVFDEIDGALLATLEPSDRIATVGLKSLLGRPDLRGTR